MMTRIKLLVAILAISLLLAGCGQPAAMPTSASRTEIGSIDETVDAQIRTLLEQGDIPSLAAGIVVNDSLAWAKGYGEQPDLDAVYGLGSIAKPFIATAVLQLYERGALDLDDDVNDYLPFAVRHPDYPDTPVTIRMLLAHRAGMAHDLPYSRIYDNDRKMLWWMFWNRGFDVENLTSLLARRRNLGEFLEKSFTPGGKYYLPEFWISEPGTAYQYSNTGLQLLLPYVVEQVSRQPFADYVQENILDPLGMTSTGYEASEFSERLARPHERIDGKLRALPRTGWNASGKLRSNVLDLSQFLIAHLNHGRNGDVQLLEPETIELMHGLISPLDWPAFFGLHWQGYGLGWELYRDGYQGHPGACPGYLSNMVFREEQQGGFGVVLMVNRGASFDTVKWASDSYAAILKLLLEEAAELYQEQAG
jgi:CubicO group peptidase (beta-lactamase class C family)